MFRTGPYGTATIPGVFPEVHLLFYARSRDRVSRLHQALGLVKQTDFGQLPDDFFVRLGAIINKKDLRFGEIERIVSSSIASSKRRNDVKK